MPLQHRRLLRLKYGQVEIKQKLLQMLFYLFSNIHDEFFVNFWGMVIVINFIRKKIMQRTSKFLVFLDQRKGGNQIIYLVLELFIVQILYFSSRFVKNRSNLLDFGQLSFIFFVEIINVILIVFLYIVEGSHQTRYSFQGGFHFIHLCGQ